MATMLTGGTHIDHADVLRSGDTGKVLPFRVMAPPSGATSASPKSSSPSQCEAAGGYPFAVQLVGKHAWDLAADRIDASAAEQAADLMTADLEAGIYRRRWTRASPLQQAYMAAAAKSSPDGRSAPTGQIHHLLGRTPKQLSSTVKALELAGTLWREAGTRGTIYSAIPGFFRYVNGLPDADIVLGDALATGPLESGGTGLELS